MYAPDQLISPAIRTAVQTCEACPDQWEGWLHDGRAFYFRYRHGVASLSIGSTPADVNGHMHVTIEYGKRDYQGHGPGAFDSDAERAEVFARTLALHAEEMRAGSEH